MKLDVIKLIQPIFTLLLFVLFLGCASGAKWQGMVPPSFDLVNHHPRSVNVSVEGGKKTNPMIASQISNKAFMQALQSSIEKSEVFTAVISGNSADYRLDVEVFEISQPLMGFNMTVSLETLWKLTRHDDNTVIWKKSITESYTATVGQAFAGVKRLRLANEGAAAANIRAGIEKISSLRL